MTYNQALEAFGECIADKAVLQAEIDRLTEELDMYYNGYHGSCMACEPVGEENQRLRESLRQCMAEIDGYIDQEYPPDAHRLYADKNRWAKEANPARVALQGEK